MTRREEMLDCAEKIEKSKGDDYVLFRIAYILIHGIETIQDIDKGDEKIKRSKQFETYLSVGALLEAARLLCGDIVWIFPVMDCTNNTVRLLNGIGFPVGGLDYQSKGETIANALAASWLKAHAKQEEQKEQELNNDQA